MTDHPEPSSFALAIEELRLTRRKLARSEAALRDIRDNAPPGTVLYCAASVVLEQNEREDAA